MRDGERPAELRTVANALAVMERLADAERALPLTELAQGAGLAPSTTHRILATLVRHGFAVRVPLHRRYRAGPAIARLARRALLEHARLSQAGRPVLEQLAARSGETSHLAVLDGSEALGIDHVESSQPVIARHPIGSRVPAHATAVGQALLAHLPGVATGSLFAELVRHTPLTIVDPEALDRSLQEIRRRGYAINVGQLHAETAGVAAAILDEGGSAVASIGISGPASRIGDPALLARLGELACDAARRVERRLSRLETPSHVPSIAARRADRRP